MMYLYLRVVVGDHCGACPLAMMIWTRVEFWRESHTWQGVLLGTWGMVGHAKDHLSGLGRCNDDCWLPLEIGVELDRCLYPYLPPGALSGHVKYVPKDFGRLFGLVTRSTLMVE